MSPVGRNENVTWSCKELIRMRLRRGEDVVDFKGMDSGVRCAFYSKKR
jgi:hypothetical protein